jgi:hypothetical protein
VENQSNSVTLKPVSAEDKGKPGKTGKLGQSGKKRGAYKQKECPYCHKHVGNLGNHVKQKHQAEVKDSPPLQPPAELTKQDLLPGDVPKMKNEAKLTSPVYYCEDCHAELRKGESECWHCHSVMDWEGINA